MRPLRFAPLAVGLLALAGCGSSSGKPDSAEQALKRDVQSLHETGHLPPTSEGTTTASDEPIGGEQAPAEARQEARERVAREDAPDSHHYPASVRDAFLHECENSSGRENAACRCAIKRIEAKVPLGRYRQNEAEVREGKPLSFIYSYEMGYCATYEAAGG